jgi:mono/diheme cytochrome c family protein
VLLLGALLLAPAGCTQIDNALASVPVFAFMRTSPAFGPYQNPRPAPPGAVPYDAPLGEVLAPLDATVAAFAEFTATPHAQNPIPADDVAALELGRVRYEVHCAVCHGAAGEGDGPVVGVGRFQMGPTLIEGPPLTQTDGYMYAVIRAGRGLMPAYGARIAHLDRWAIVNYIRTLQALSPPAAPAQPLEPADGAEPVQPVEPPQPGAGAAEGR